MFGTQDLPLFIVTALVLNATPGVDLLYTVSRSLQAGWRAGVAAALGIGAGCVVHALAAALGMAALLTASSTAFTVIKLLGALYLAWLAMGLLRAAWHGAPTTAGRPAAVRTVSLRQVFVQGFLTNVLNPKVALFFLALLPQFIAADAPHKALAFLFLGSVFVVNGTLFLFAIVALASQARRVGVPPGWTRLAQATGGLLFALLALRLALSKAEAA
jgi:threonine/homoserine/homoserine lactone efflux protein